MSPGGRCLVCPLLHRKCDRGKAAGAARGSQAGQEGTTMERMFTTIQGRGFQGLVVKLALSFGMVLWMFLVATLSHV